MNSVQMIFLYGIIHFNLKPGTGVYDQPQSETWY